jgi:hypothetical protein
LDGISVTFANSSDEPFNATKSVAKHLAVYFSDRDRFVASST